MVNQIYLGSRCSHLLNTCHAVALALTGSVIGHTLHAADSIVAEVNGQPVTLRQLEDELLRREGTDQLIELVEERLKGARWSAIDDEQVVVAVPGGVVRRIDIALRTLEQDGAKVRNELITMMATRQAITHAGIIIDRALVDAEVAREQRRFSRRLTAAGRPAMPFEQAVLAKEGITIREWRRSDAVRIAAGLHELVLRTIQPDELAIQEHYAKFPERFEQREAVKLQLIFIPFRTVELDGQTLPDPRHQRNLRGVMNEIHHQLLQGKQQFAETWNLWGSGYDQMAEDGIVGWVDREGHTSIPGVQPIPATSANKPSTVTSIAYPACSNRSFQMMACASYKFSATALNSNNRSMTSAIKSAATLLNRTLKNTPDKSSPISSTNPTST